MAGLWDKTGKSKWLKANTHLHRSGWKRQQFRALQTEESSKKQNSEDEEQDRAKRRGGK